jgi:hypothetical protein
MALGQNSFICKRPFFAKNKFTFANLSRTHVFLPRGYGCSLCCCCWDVFKLHVNSNCRQPRVGARRCKAVQGHVMIIPPGNHRVSLFPGSLDGTKVPCGLWVSMDTFSFATAFAELSRKIICKSTTNSTPWIVLACAAPFDYKYIALGSTLFILQFNSAGSHFTPRKTRECMINRLIKINFR